MKIFGITIGKTKVPPVAVSNVRPTIQEYGTTIGETPYPQDIGDPRFTVPQYDPNNATMTFRVVAPTVDQEIALMQAHRWPNEGTENNWYLQNNPRDRQLEERISCPDSFIEQSVSSVPAPDPRWNPPQPLRGPYKAPSVYAFFRPSYGQDVAERLNGRHFSMASNSRTYPITGVETVRNRRNTYRVEPVPYDVSITDVPTNIGPSNPQAVFTSPQVTSAGAANGYRLS